MVQKLTVHFYFRWQCIHFKWSTLCCSYPWPRNVLLSLSDKTWDWVWNRRELCSVSCLLVACKCVVPLANSLFRLFALQEHVTVCAMLSCGMHSVQKLYLHDMIFLCIYCRSILSLVQFLFSFVSHSLSYINIKKNEGK